MINLNVTVHADDAIIIYCANKVVIAYTKNPKYHGRSQHIETRYHFIRDIVAQGQIVSRFTSTSDIIADPFTKSLVRDIFHKYVKKLGLCKI